MNMRQQTNFSPAEFRFRPIGHVRCAQRYRYEAPRQAALADNHGLIQLLPECHFEQALADLAGFDRIWVIYCFHLNQTWHPIVRPPVVGAKAKISVFATRSPHRPNPLGLSCVELVKVNGLEVHIRNFDMLDGTPALDLKPYLPSADAFPESRTGWLEAVSAARYEVRFSAPVLTWSEWIFSASGLDLKRFCEVQLMHNPLDESRKRLMDGGVPGEYVIACRTWRITFALNEAARSIEVTGIKSGYADQELAPASPDPYADKAVHREFRRRFPEL